MPAGSKKGINSLALAGDTRSMSTPNLLTAFDIAPQLLFVVSSARDSQGARLEVDHFFTGLGREALDLFDTHDSEPGHQFRFADCRRQSRCARRGLRGDLMLIDQGNGSDAALCQVIGNAGPERARADDDGCSFLKHSTNKVSGFFGCR